MDGWSILGQILILLGSAALLGGLVERIGLNAIVGYLLAGTFVGPGLLGWVGSGTEAESAAISEVAELGVAFLLFTIGLEISHATMRRQGLQYLSAGSLQMVLTGVPTCLIAVALGEPWPTAIVIAAVVALSSTAVVGRILGERAETESRHGRLGIGILLTQDLALVPLLIVLPVLAGGAGWMGVTSGLADMGWAMILLAGGLLLFGLYVLPFVLGIRAVTKNREIPVVIAVVACLTAMWGGHSLGLSPSIGAFLVGILCAGSPLARQLRADVAPLKAVLLTLFFASIGMLADASWLMDGWHLLLVIALAIAIIVGKSLIGAIAALIAGFDRVTAIAGGILISQMGEFSFVIAASAWGLGIIDEQAFQFLTGASLVTLLIAPLLIPRSITLARRLSAILPRSRRSSSEQQGASVVLDNHVIVVGFGPAGRTVSRILADEGRKILVIDANHRLVAAAHGAGYAVATGNAARPDLLRWSGIDTASALVVAAPDHREAVAIVEAARTLAPHLQIVSRTRYNAHTASLLQAGATVAVSEEDGIGHVLADLVTARMKPEGVAGD